MRPSSRLTPFWIIVPTLLIVLLSTFSVSAMPPSPEVLENLKATGQLQTLIDRFEQARLNGFNEPFQRSTARAKSGEQPFPVLSASAAAPDTFRVVVLLADFDDNQVSGGMVAGTVADFEHLLFSFDSTDNFYSMSEFYYDNSYGTFYLEGVVSGWYRLPQTYAYYVDGQNGFGSYPQNAARMTEDAVLMADPNVDFSQFDNDNDGWCDGVFIVHAGPGAESTSSDDHIWSHASQTSYTMNVDGINLRRYTTEPEELSGSLITQGVFSHEYGHFLGLPDLYDTDYSSEGCGDWSLMAGGSWNWSGAKPAFMDAWCKKELGFVTPIEVFSNIQDVQLPASYYNPVVYKLWQNGIYGNEYFLIENRQKRDNDPGIPGSGLLILHIDDNQWGNSDETHYLVAVEQADGFFHLENNNNDGDAGDVWSTATKKEFSNLTNPSTKNYAGSNTRTSVWNISASDSIMTANFDISYSRPNMNLTSTLFSDATFGNNNGAVEPGESITYTFSVDNLWLTATNVTAELYSDNPSFIFTTNDVNIGAVLGEGGSGDNNSLPIVFDIPATYDPCIDSFFLVLTSDNPLHNDTFALELHVGQPEILVVDDDNGADYTDSLTTSLRNFRVPFDVYNKSVSGSPTGAILNQYKIVMWLTGDERPDILTVSDVTAMQTYLDGGGKLFLTGQMIANELSVQNITFLNTYLKADFVQDQLFPIINGVPGTDVGDTLKIRFDSFTNQQNPSTMTAINGGITEFELPVGGAQGISYKGSYSTLFFGFGFEAISPNYVSHGYTVKDSLMVRILSFFEYGDVNQPSNPAVSDLDFAGELSLQSVVNHTPDINWNYTDNGSVPQTQYQVQVGTGVLCTNSSDMWDSGIQSGTATNISYAGLPLYDGYTYYVRVRSYNGTDWSTWRRVPFTMNQAATTVTQITPADNQVVTLAQPVLEVTNATDPNGDIITYDFEVYSDAVMTTLVASGNNIAEGVGTTAWTVATPLAEDAEFFWRCRPFDGYEGSPFSSLSNFFVNAVNQSPTPFDLVSPADGVFETGLNPTLIWQKSTDSDIVDTVHYELRLYDDASLATWTSYSDLTDTTYSLSGLNDKQEYFWQVYSVDRQYDSTASTSLYSFNTGTPGCCVGLTGNVNGDGGDVLDISDLLYLVDHFFADPLGPAPVCAEEADVNGSGILDISDLLYLVDYFFLDPSGPAPASCP